MTRNQHNNSDDKIKNIYHYSTRAVYMKGRILKKLYPTFLDNSLVLTDCFVSISMRKKSSQKSALKTSKQKCSQSEVKSWHQLPILTSPQGSLHTSLKREI